MGGAGGLEGSGAATWTDSATGGATAGGVTWGVGGVGGRTGTTGGAGGAGGATTGTFATGAGGRGTTVGTTGRGGGGGATGGLAAGTTGGGSTRAWTMGGRAGAAGACCLRMALRTSPGREICERSILVLISSLPARLSRALLAAGASPAAARKCARTFSASWSSSELEWVFFSVTPTAGSTSRIALLLTSSSLARSLIRILLILLFAPPTLLL